MVLTGAMYSRSYSDCSGVSAIGVLVGSVCRFACRFAVGVVGTIVGSIVVPGVGTVNGSVVVFSFAFALVVFVVVFGTNVPVALSLACSEEEGGCTLSFGDSLVAFVLVIELVVDMILCSK